jgi:two-component system response regulator GlrR
MRACSSGSARKPITASAFSGKTISSKCYRELEHVIQRAVVLCDEGCIQGKDIHIQKRETPEQGEPFGTLKNRVVAQFEKNYIQQLLRSCEGNITRAATIAQKNRRAFWQLIRKHHIDVRRFKTTV